MKRLLLIFLLLFLTHQIVFCQNIFPSAGNVGIGTSSPNALLDVRGASQFIGPLFAANGLRVAGSSTDLTNGYSWYGMGLVDSMSFGKNIIQLAGYWGLYFKTGNAQMLLTESGNIGVGLTSNISERLTVDGNVKAKEVIVTTSGWPDYVFKKDYELPSLESLSAQIKTDGHLPDMPSAEEVEDKGQNLGEMNKKLLQKVEELTLYIIQQDKALSEQRQRNDTAEERLNRQQAEIEALRKAIPALSDKQEFANKK